MSDFDPPFDASLDTSLDQSAGPPDYHNHDTESSSQEYSLVPWQQLSQEALVGVAEAFIEREGTDYGLQEVDHATKVEQVLSQVRSGVAVIVFDHDSQSVTILHKDEIR